MITLHDYWMGRDASHPTLMSPMLEKNAGITVECVNALLALAQIAGVVLLPAPLHPQFGYVASGWRPPEVNASTPGAATGSKHLLAQACDIYDPHGELDRWLMTDDGQRALTDIGLWMEHPDKTPTWAHVQTVPPGSGRRVFWP